jgi:hypothetical protein
MSSSITSAPVTEVAYLTLKEGKESQRGELEGFISDLKENIATTAGFRGFTWGQSLDPGKENVYMLVLGWDTVTVEHHSQKQTVGDIDDDVCRRTGMLSDQKHIAANFSKIRSDPSHTSIWCMLLCFEELENYRNKRCCKMK